MPQILQAQSIIIKLFIICTAVFSISADSITIIYQYHPFWLTASVLPLSCSPTSHESPHPAAFISWFHILLSQSMVAALVLALIISFLDHKCILINLLFSRPLIILLARWLILRRKCGHATPLHKLWNGSTEPARRVVIHSQGSIAILDLAPACCSSLCVCFSLPYSLYSTTTKPFIAFSTCHCTDLTSADLTCLYSSCCLECSLLLLLCLLTLDDPLEAFCNQPSPSWL